ncbi:MAG: hypothetical protein BWY99_02893 [Synergistetes bacterium ADurb.BinA166]|nr:MAG: hypothetical protein BWY99_02893 [Synergistetes bacterium ADurb.BinA166]
MMLLSDFSLRRIKGAVARRRRSAASVSPSLVMGVWKRLLNALAEPRSPGFRKSIRDQRSPTWFSTGVPVKATRYPERRERTARDCFASGFFTFCASSRSTPAHSTSLRNAMSRWTRA